jgi:hypothetical protein
MVLAALGAPENKMREQQSGDPNGARYEEWIYGHVPQTIRFVRFVGDRVTMVEVAALGKPIEIHNTNEMGDFDPAPTREVAMGDKDAKGPEEGKQAAPPTLRLPGEAAPADGPGKVQFPTKSSAAPIPPTPTADPGPGTDAGASPGGGSATNPGANQGPNSGTSPRSNPKPPMQ